MSMVGSSLLHQLINEKGITEPEQILEHLNAAIIYTLNQDETESNDGMDIALCSFDFNSNTVEFSGANRPLWLIRNNEFTAVKPDKFPIGGLQMQQGRSFTRHTLALQPGDAIYIFSDGYADQFGGPNGKKMLSSKFREKLLGLQQIKMAEQGDILRKHFDDWKGSLDQVDDVLVIGIRV
jgi:serine phosphatase RsbU (regulator of sigma subunit)